MQRPTSNLLHAVDGGNALKLGVMIVDSLFVEKVVLDRFRPSLVDETDMNPDALGLILVR